MSEFEVGKPIRIKKEYLKKPSLTTRQRLVRWALVSTLLIGGGGLVKQHFSSGPEFGTAQESVIQVQEASDRVSEAIADLSGGLQFNEEEMASWGYHVRDIWKKNGDYFVPGGEEAIRGSISPDKTDNYVILDRELPAWNAGYPDKSREENTKAYPVIKKDNLVKILTEGKSIDIRKDTVGAVHKVVTKKD